MRFGRFLLGLTFIVIGTVMFMVNIGYTSMDFLYQLVDLWPVLLILFGLSLMWGGKIPSLFAVLIAVGVVAVVIYLATGYQGNYYGPGPFALACAIITAYL